MNQWTVEYYSDDNGEWLECSPAYLCLDDALSSMRLQAENDPAMPHRVIRAVIHRSTAAMSVYGEELIK